MSNPKAVGMIFNQMYSDGSGEERAVKLIEGGNSIAVSDGGSTAEFPIEEIEWLIACLQRIRNEVRAT